MLNQNYITLPQKSNMQHSPFSLEENLAAGKENGLNAIKKARLFTGTIHMGQLRSNACGDPELLEHFLKTAESWDVRVLEQ